ncbi:BlaI/MecI/CopY family transcriptional regulator [Thiospirochaeta perfilievii]|nr:BlaI/MecI/CopY family transcriptional regulator [Thiospirochaeta perfilievii]
MKKINVPELELKILNVLWRKNEPLKVQGIIDNWLDDKEPGYTTILKKLQIMEEKNLVNHHKNGRSYSYFPTINKDEVSHSKFKKLLGDLFSGNKLEMAAAFVKDTDLTKDELSTLIEMLQKEKDK